MQHVGYRDSKGNRTGKARGYIGLLLWIILIYSP